MSTACSVRRLLVPAFGLLALLSTSVLRLEAQVKQTNLVSDLPGWAAHTDPNLVNPWGISLSPKSPFWVSDAGAGVSTLYTGTGNVIPLVVTIPNAGGGPAVPTGQVFNGGTAFNGDLFIFASARGTITGWRGALGTTAETLYAPTTPSSYLGLAIATVGANSYLYAADFRNNQVTVIPSTAAPNLTGTFADSTIPAGYAPFNIQNMGGHLFVTYAQQDPAGPKEITGAGKGYINEFDLNGNLIGRVASGGPLNAPWGLAMAPLSFGKYGGDLLVGNFGDGTIDAFNPTSGAFIDTLRNSFGDPIVNSGLWGITFGNGVNSRADSLYFAAGIEGETHGLFGRLSPVPEPSVTGASAGLLLFGLSVAKWRRRKLSRVAIAATSESPIATGTGAA